MITRRSEVLQSELRHMTAGDFAPGVCRRRWHKRAHAKVQRSAGHSDGSVEVLEDGRLVG